MNSFEENYLNRSLTTLQDALPLQPEELMKQYEADSRLWSVESVNGLVYCLFTVPVNSSMSQIILLVYSPDDQIIADIGAYHTSTRSFLEDCELYDILSRESDWMYLEHYVLSSTLFEAYPYPFCLSNQKADENGEVLLFTNAYVSVSCRRQGIFRTMLDTVTDNLLNQKTGIVTICSVMSMDPDVACYGPDTREEPYYYSYEADEPVRMTNKLIAEKTGFLPLRLKPDHPEEETDGTKLWFCIRREVYNIVDTEGSV
ncbi:MAG: hypothetical protein IKS32_07445 [Solobacterium sp.]|nr:hypothetical protein [Solobacterium sp.]